MELKNRVFRRLEQFLPPGTHEFCHELYQENPFKLVISRHRITKLGDYRYDKKGDTHRISVNGTLNPYSFLITYLHEVAHLQVMLSFGPHVRHHGVEWKREFQKLLIRLLTMEVLPEELSKALAQYARNPRATSHGFLPLARVLEKYDPESDSKRLLDVPDGSFFEFKGKEYQKLEKRRTRVVCLRISNGINYLISGAASVKYIIK